MSSNNKIAATEFENLKQNINHFLKGNTIDFDSRKVYYTLYKLGRKKQFRTVEMSFAIFCTYVSLSVVAARYHLDELKEVGLIEKLSFFEENITVNIKKFEDASA